MYATRMRILAGRLVGRRLIDASGHSLDILRQVANLFDSVGTYISSVMIYMGCFCVRSNVGPV